MLTFANDEARLTSFARSLDALKREIESTTGAEDIAYMQDVRRVSRALEIGGRTLIHFSLEPVTFGVGVLALYANKSLELMEIGHNVLHGTYDRMEGADDLRSESFHWKAPIDETSWRSAHNLRHHQHTNIAGRDPDVDFGALRLSEHIKHRAIHRLQPVSNFITWLAFANAINLHVSGVIEVYFGRDERQVLPDRSWGSFKAAHTAYAKKAARYYAREFVLFPALAGPVFWKTLLGNVLSDVGRDVHAAAIIYCGHVGAEEFPAKAHAKGRAAWYAMQVEATRNVDMPRWLSILSGGLDKQIEHHLFPRLPPNRLRQIAPRVRQICEDHGVFYGSESWPKSLGRLTRRLRELASPTSRKELKTKPVGPGLAPSSLQDASAS